MPAPVIDDKAHQPSCFHFPQCDFGKASVVKRSFQWLWFDRWSWQHCDKDWDLAFCLRASLCTRKITCCLLLARRSIHFNWFL